MSYSLMIASFDFANHKKIAAQQFFDNYAFFELTPKRAKEYFLWYKNEIPNRIAMKQRLNRFPRPGKKSSIVFPNIRSGWRRIYEK